MALPNLVGMELTGAGPAEVAAVRDVGSSTPLSPETPQKPGFPTASSGAATSTPPPNYSMGMSRLLSETYDNLTQLPMSPITSMLSPGIAQGHHLDLDPLSQSFTFGTLPRKPEFLVKIRGTGADLNATYPATGSSRMRVCGARGLRKLQGHGMDTISFSPLRGGASATPRPDAREAEWGMRSVIGHRSSTALLAPGPSKSLITIDGSGTILVANQNACELFGFKPSEITKENLNTLLPKGKAVSGKVVSELMIDDEGQVETVNGRVVEGIDRIGNIFPVSLYLTKLEVQDSTKPRFMAVMEPVARETAQVTLDEHGAILWCDSTLLKIYHLERSDILGMHLSKLIPSLSLSSARTVQHVVTKGSESIVIPATLMLGPVDAQTKEKLVGDGLPSTDSARVEELGTIHVYRNISGLITCDEEGLVCSCNDNFVLLLFGYTEHQLKGKPVHKILPDIPSGSLGSFFDADDTFGSHSPTKVGPGDPPEHNFMSKKAGPSRGAHRDGMNFGVSWQMKKIVDKDFKAYFCLWISRDTPSELSFTCSEPEDRGDASLQSEMGVSAASHEDGIIDDRFTTGLFGETYVVTEPVGTGSFGTVAKARPRTGGSDVVVKCIVKAKVLSECWDATPDEPWVEALTAGIDDSIRETIPREIVLLMRLEHENIVRAIEVFHNEDIFQLVFEHKGECIDLFQYIEDNVGDGDEVKAVHIFKQMNAAVAYLHENNIVHRDIKDENVVLDNQLNARLIDFGSAHYIKKGKLFDTFCGTLEYCAPEVLLGNPYAGKELDMFALGVTLFTLVFGERPFFDVEETIAGVLCPPFEVNELCSSALLWILDCDPKKRATAQEMMTTAWVTKTQRLSFSSVSTGKLSSRTSLNIGEDAEDDAFEDELSETYDRLANF